MKVVLAGNHAQYQHWARAYGWDQREYRYVSSPHQIVGLGPGTELYMVGEYWRSPLYREARDRAETYGWVLP